MNKKEMIDKIEEKEKPEFGLSRDHLFYAIQMVKRHITKRYLRKGCKRCGLTGISYINKYNELVTCQCVDEYNARKEWIEYCNQFPELKARYGK